MQLVIFTNITQLYGDMALTPRKTKAVVNGVIAKWNLGDAFVHNNEKYDGTVCVMLTTLWGVNTEQSSREKNVLTKAPQTY